jgi:hypothetical protein
MIALFVFAFLTIAALFYLLVSKFVKDYRKRIDLSWVLLEFGLAFEVTGAYIEDRQALRSENDFHIKEPIIHMNYVLKTFSISL